MAQTRKTRIASRDALRRHRDDILRIAARYGAHDVRVFGSVARGDAGPDSDIDLLVSLEPGRSLFDLGGLWYDLNETLGLRIDVVTEGSVAARMRARVLSEAVPL